MLQFIMRGLVLGRAAHLSSVCQGSAAKLAARSLCSIPARARPSVPAPGTVWPAARSLSPAVLPALAHRPQRSLHVSHCSSSESNGTTSGPSKDEPQAQASNGVPKSPEASSQSTPTTAAATAPVTGVQTLLQPESTDTAPRTTAPPRQYTSHIVADTSLLQQLNRTPEHYAEGEWGLCSGRPWQEPMPCRTTAHTWAAQTAECGALTPSAMLSTHLVLCTLLPVLHAPVVP